MVKFVNELLTSLKPPLLCKGGGFERQREDGGIIIVNAMYRPM